MGFKVGIAGTFTIEFAGADGFDASIPVYLEDTKENIFVNLRENQTYTFDYNPDDNENRFNIHFTKPANVEENEISIYSAGKRIFILNPGNINSSIEIYNVTGQRIKTLNLNGNTAEIDMNVSGNYFVRLISGEKIVCTKVFVQ